MPCVLSNTEHWLNWILFFSPLSGHDAKQVNPRERYLIATFCYGCNLGPMQTARSINNLDRRPILLVLYDEGSSNIPVLSERMFN